MEVSQSNVKQYTLFVCSPVEAGEGSSDPIQMQILGPVDTVIPAGQTVQFLCQAFPAVTRPRELLTLQWVR